MSSCLLSFTSAIISAGTASSLNVNLKIKELPDEDKAFNTGIFFVGTICFQPQNTATTRWVCMHDTSIVFTCRNHSYCKASTKIRFQNSADQLQQKPSSAEHLPQGIIKIDSFLVHKVHNTFMICFQPNGQLHQSSVVIQSWSGRTTTMDSHCAIIGLGGQIVWKTNCKSKAYRSCDSTRFGFDPVLSSLLINARQGTWYLLICLSTVYVWLWTPPTAHRTSTAPSKTRSALSTSTVKSTWPVSKWNMKKTQIWRNNKVCWSPKDA